MHNPQRDLTGTVHARQKQALSTRPNGALVYIGRKNFTNFMLVKDFVFDVYKHMLKSKETELARTCFKIRLIIETDLFPCSV